ncbi:hypothetical protein HUJ04_012324 [Dendroctonus ponderosae]|nr:hypothetical protein HUJ04_012324 [Dendroctonus ponderosae]KAH1029494.1 hypothetical protein HUJ05_002723 [Dendroctonus ponderosae]
MSPVCKCSAGRRTACTDGVSLLWASVGLDPQFRFNFKSNDKRKIKTANLELSSRLECTSDMSYL